MIFLHGQVLRRFAVFYYLVLFAICVVVGLVVLWLYKEASNIGKNANGIGKRDSKTDPTDHLKGVLVNTAINDEPTPRGGEGRRLPKHPARSQAAMPSRSSYWDLPGDKHESDKLHAYPGGSKSESEFWSYLGSPDRPGHGTGSSRS